MIINKDEWKMIFRKDIKDKLHESFREYTQYKKTGKVVYLQQAGNKLFSVVENWLMVKYNVRVSSYQELRGVVKNNKNDRRLLAKVSRLHYFYYANIVYDDPNDIAESYLEIYEIMKRRIK